MAGLPDFNLAFCPRNTCKAKLYIRATQFNSKAEMDFGMRRHENRLLKPAISFPMHTRYSVQVLCDHSRKNIWFKELKRCTWLCLHMICPLRHCTLELHIIKNVEHRNVIKALCLSPC